MSEIQQIADRFRFDGRFHSAVPYGNGHINDTFAVVYVREDGTSIRYILQRINHHVFRQPALLMENMRAVTDHLHGRVLAAGGDPYRKAVTIVPARDGTSFVQLEDGTFWRSQVFIEGSLCIDQVEDVRHLYEAGRAFGTFQRLLGDFPVHSLHETIPDFHDTPIRLAAFERAVTADGVGRVRDTSQEIAFVRERASSAGRLVELLAQGRLPLRVTHNDTKLNNVLFDDETGESVCVIDLDTVMPGLSLYDFGDAIRFATNTAAEDETDLSCVHFDLVLFEHFTRGFLETAGEVLTSEEVRQLCFSARLMTYECGTRFLTDHLSGDVYFRIHRPDQNLDRARCQFRLLEDMERQADEMERIVRRVNPYVSGSEGDGRGGENPDQTIEGIG